MDLDENFEDLMPNDGGILNLNAPKEQTIEMQTEKGEVLASAPVINAILAWFDDEIALCDSIVGLDLESTVDLKVQILARQVVADKLKAAKERLMIQRDAFIPQREL